MIQTFTPELRGGTTLCRLGAGIGGLLACCSAWAAPQGLTVVSGTATATPNGPNLNITVGSDRAVLQWGTFNVAPGESVIFHQPSATSIAWNQVMDPHPSTIFGNIQANGIVVLANQAGFWFGPDSVVKAASFIATTAAGPGADFMAGGSWNINVAPPLASIINYGHLEAERGGSVFLVAEKIENHGVLTAPDGTLGLYAGKEVLVSERPDGRGLSAQVTLPTGSIDNHGKLIADAGTIALHARVVNQAGTLQADSLREHDGVIELVASDSLTLGPGSVTQADGDSSSSAPSAAGGQITLQAKNNISVNTFWNLADTLAPGAHLTLEAGRDILFAANAGIAAGNGWSLTLAAGRLFSGAGGTVAGTGSILFNGSSFASATDGQIRLSAGKDITVNRGYVRTTAGGNITATTVSGNINTGLASDGFRFSNQDTGYTVSDNLGGISTAAGGSITLGAGKDVISYLPTLIGNHTDGGSGAFGAEPGDVTVTAGGSVYGHFVVRNGIGHITAANLAGDNNRQLALSLVKGSWEVDATDITLQEVRNPNGVFNRVGNQNTPTFHSFDYDPLAVVSLNASDTVSLLGASLPRNPSDNVPVVYAPSLRIRAGAGGIVLGNNVDLFPSPVGQLDLATTAGGDLRSKEDGRTYELVLSDSASRRFTFSSGQFGLLDHAPIPVHLDDAEPARIAISGSIRGLVIGIPKAARIEVGADVVDSSFLGQNLAPADTTSLVVHGDIRNRNDYTFVTLPPGVSPPDLTLLQIAEPSAGDAAFTYDAATRVLGFRGRLTDNVLSSLIDLHVRTFENGTPGVVGSGTLLVDSNGDPVTVPAAFLPAEILNDLYARSQDVPIRPPAGYQVGGPGHFVVSARNIDLGVTAGILSVGAGANPSLGKYSPQGADIDVTTTGDLVMFSSAIVSRAGGAIHVDAGGDLQAGSTLTLPTSDQARGIYSTAGSDVSVTARHDILINGSRIAAYDGGNVTVRSLEGNVDAGSGGLSLQNVEQVHVDPVTGQVSTLTDFIPGSGILATTFSTGSTRVGDIRVETPRGNIYARSGGIVQAAFNGSSSSGSDVTLTAGTKPIEGQPGSGFVGSIDASHSGVIGGNVALDATGPILGVIFATGNINLTTPLSVNITALAQGSANVSAGGSVSGTVVGIGSANVSGGSISASVHSQNATTSGARSGQVGFAAANVAGATAQAAQGESPAKRAAAAEPVEDEDKGKAARRPQIMRTVGRVTVILPPGKPQ